MVLSPEICTLDLEGNFITFVVVSFVVGVAVDGVVVVLVVAVA